MQLPKYFVLKKYQERYNPRYWLVQKLCDFIGQFVVTRRAYNARQTLQQTTTLGYPANQLTWRLTYRRIASIAALHFAHNCQTWMEIGQTT